MPVDRAPLHELIDRLLDAREVAENAAAAGDGRAATCAASEVYNLLWTFAREAAAPAVKLILRRGTIPSRTPCPSGTKRRAGGAGQ